MNKKEEELQAIRSSLKFDKELNHICPMHRLRLNQIKGWNKYYWSCPSYKSCEYAISKDKVDYAINDYKDRLRYKQELDDILKN